MKRHTKQRLFEVLAKIDNTFKTDITPELGERIYVKPNEIPPQIIAWATSILGKGFENRITIQKSNGVVDVGMPWHDADRETHQFFKLTDGGAAGMGKAVSRSGWSEANMGDVYGKVPIPSGYILATAGTYPKRLEIVTNTDALTPISDYSDIINKLSDDALVALYNAKAFKSPYRQKFDTGVYQELMALGLMNSQKAITTDGRNFINSGDAKNRIEAIKVKDREENGWNRKYKLF